MNGLLNWKISKYLSLSNTVYHKNYVLGSYSFYNIAINTGDTIKNVRNAVYSDRSLELKKKYKLEKRINLGVFMREKSEGGNTFEKIQARTGIEKQRLINIYFNTGATEPYEFLLIEKAVGKKTR